MLVSVISLFKRDNIHFLNIIEKLDRYYHVLMYRKV